MKLREKLNSMTGKFSSFLIILLLSPMCLLSQLYSELPIGFPHFEVTVSDNPSSGYYFMSGNYFGNENRKYAIILDTLGFPVFYQKHPQSNRVQGFTLQENGLLSYCSGSSTELYFNVIDSTYQLAKTIIPLNGFYLDPHELIIENDNSYWLLAFDPRVYDMSQIIHGGCTEAIVKGCLIQHIDENQNLLFEWSSWDHMDITDCDTNFVDLTDDVIDYVHANSLSIDYDGNILLSCRHMNEITKINVSTGEIIWRWGGNKNQFTFANEQDIFYGQHTIRYQADSDTYTLFDNGNFQSPAHSTGKEFELDQINLIATCINIFDHDPLIYTAAMGGMQRMNNGSTIVNWTRGFNIVTEYNNQGDVVFEISCIDSLFQSYRILKYDWKTSLFDYQEDIINFENIPLGDSANQQIVVTNNQNYDVIINGFNIVDSSFSLKTELPITLGANSSFNFEIMFKPTDTLYCEGILSLFHSTDTSRVAQQIRLTGSITVGINDNLMSDSDNVIIYPNPANEKVTFELPNNQTISNITLIDTKGSKVLEKHLPNVRSYTLCNNLPSSGIYFVQLSNKNGIYKGKLIIK